MRKSLLLGFIFCFFVSFGQDSGLKLKESEIKTAARQVWAMIVQEVARSGGDLEKQNINLVLALGTSYFKSDPLRAQAARTLAAEILAQHLVPGDSVEVYAFEYGVWLHRPDQKPARLSLSNRSRMEISSLEGLFPTTPQEGSLGGQDPEQTIVDLVRFVAKQNSVLLLISNTAAPLSRGGKPLLGSNAEAYLEATKGWRRPVHTKNGATLEVPYTVERLGQRVAQHKLDLILLVPDTFQAPALPELRCQILGTCAVSQAAAPVKDGFKGKDGRVSIGAVGPAVVMLVVVVLMFVFGPQLISAGGFFRPSMSSYDISVEGQRFSLRGLTPGQLILSLVGRGYGENSAGHKVVLPQIPGGEIARLYMANQGIRVEGVDLSLVAINEKGILNNEGFLKAVDGQKYRLRFAGEIQDARGISRHVEAETNLVFTRG